MKGVRELNLELGRPTVDQALDRLRADMDACRHMHQGVMKLIHGYGSSGSGGRIRTAVRKYLAGELAEGRVKAVIRGEDFSIAIPAQYLAFYKEELGLTISAGIDKTTFYARVKVMPDDPVSFSEEDYFENVWLPNLRSIYIGKNYSMVLDEGKTQTYTVSGREMIGHPFLIKIAGKENCDLMLFDRWDGRVIRYELYYPQNDTDAALLLLGNIVRSVTKHALAPKETKQTVADGIHRREGPHPVYHGVSKQQPDRRRLRIPERTVYAAYERSLR